ncbi:MAG: hypothetical protein Q9174_003098, partial [Haloplaca sp. 1 TL-2023]
HPINPSDPESPNTLPTAKMVTLRNRRIHSPSLPSTAPSQKKTKTTVTKAGKPTAAVKKKAAPKGKGKAGKGKGNKGKGKGRPKAKTSKQADVQQTPLSLSKRDHETTMVSMPFVQERKILKKAVGKGKEKGAKPDTKEAASLIMMPEPGTRAQSVL